MADHRLYNNHSFYSSDYYNSQYIPDNNSQENMSMPYYSNDNCSIMPDSKFQRFIRPSYILPAQCEELIQAENIYDTQNSFYFDADRPSNNPTVPYFPSSEGFRQPLPQYNSRLYMSQAYHSHEDYAPSPQFKRVESVPESSYKNWKVTPSSSSGISRSPNMKRVVNPSDGFIYQVQFKRAHRNFVLAPSAPRDILPGDFVKVEADRGEDMGIVLAKCPVDSFEEVVPTAGYRGRGFSSGHGERKYLYRLATAEERTALSGKVHDEEKALEIIRDKAAERGLPMTVLDAEYQFDRHKLTFYFEADRRIDFRELVSELFSHYKTRIWMQQVDTSTLTIHDPGLELAKATGFLPERDDCLSIRSSISVGFDDIVCSGSLSDSIDTDTQLEQFSTDTIWSRSNGQVPQDFQHNKTSLLPRFHDKWNRI